MIECRIRDVHDLKLRDFSRIFLDEFAVCGTSLLAREPKTSKFRS